MVVQSSAVRRPGRIIAAARSVNDASATRIHPVRRRAGSGSKDVLMMSFDTQGTVLIQRVLNHLVSPTASSVLCVRWHVLLVWCVMSKLLVLATGPIAQYVTLTNGARLSVLPTDTIYTRVVSRRQE
jgi:hypothetical protein